MAGAGLSDYEVKWLADGPDPATLKTEISEGGKRVKQREDLLDQLIVKNIGDLKNGISKAQDVVLKQQSGSDALNAVWKSVLGKSDGFVTKSLKWRASDDDNLHLAADRRVQTNWDTRADVEFDTVADGQSLVEVPPEQLKALQSALDAIVATQHEMLNSFDENGNPLFSEKDIMNELWTPLVRAGTIPENMVPDRYSETAHAFDGACEIYNDKLKSFAEQSHGHEDLLSVLSVVKDTGELFGTVAVNAVKISSAMEIASKQEQLTKGVDENGKALSGSQKEAMREDVSRLQNEVKFAGLAQAVTNGALDLGFDFAKEKVKAKDDQDWWNFAEKAVTLTISLMIQAVDPVLTEMEGHREVANAKTWSNGDDPGKKAQGDAVLEKLKIIKTVKISVQAGMVGIKMGGTLRRAYVAYQKGEEGIAIKVLGELGAEIGDAVALSMAAVGNQMGGASGAEMRQIGAGVAAAIRASAKGPAILKALQDGNVKGAAVLLGAMAVQAGLSAGSEQLFDALHRDVSKDDYAKLDKHERLIVEKTGSSQELGQNTASADMIDKISKAMEKVSPALLQKIEDMEISDFESDEEKALGLKVQREVEKKAQEKAEAELKKAFGDPKAVKEMLADFDHQTKYIEEMYAAAFPDDQLPAAPPDEIAKAMDQIDHAIAQSQALRQKVAMINAVTSAGASVLAAFVPGGGAVVAAQKIAFDIYAICKAVQLHNNWCESMEISFRANSAYGPAIERTMKNARIELSQRSVEIILHSLQLGTEVGKFFDPTGATTIASASLSMADAVQKYSYKMHKKAAIIKGWRAYKKAIHNPGNRKAARKALRLNSTLAKCCIAYGASIAQDPAAMEAMRVSGLTVSALQDDKDVCNKLVAYLQEQLRNDPNELRVQTEPAEWQPGRPKLNPVSWFETKSAAATKAMPRLSPGSVATPGIDKLMTEIAGPNGFDGAESYASVRDSLKATGKDDFAREMDLYKKRKMVAQGISPLLHNLKTALDGYRPVEDAPGGSKPHEIMRDITETLIATVNINLKQVEADVNAKQPVPPAKAKPTQN